MRIAAVDVHAFGALHDRRFVTDSDFVVVFGRNEEGKSSLHRALGTALFGFSPQSAAAHPLISSTFAPASEGDAGALSLFLGAQIQMGRGDGARSLWVERRMTPGSVEMRLRTSQDRDPTGAAAGYVRGNDPLGETGSVGLELFEAVYCLGPDDARAADRHLGAAIDGLLLGGGRSVDLPSSLELRTQIDAERQKLWRPDRRSKRTRAAEIDTALKALRLEAREATRVEQSLMDREGELRDRIEEVRTMRAQLPGRSAAVEALRVIERVAQAVLDSKEDEVDLTVLDDVEISSPGPLLEELEDRELQLEEPTARLALEPRALIPFQLRVLERAADIEAMESEARERESRLTEAQNLELRARERGIGADDLERTVISPGAGGVPDLPELRSLMGGWASGDGEALESPTSRGRLWVALAAGAAGAAAAHLAGAHWAGALVAAAAPLAVILTGSTLAPEEGRPGPPADLLRALKAAGIPPLLAGTPEAAEALVQRLARAALLRDEARELLRQAEVSRSEAEAIAVRWRELARGIGSRSDGSQLPAADDRLPDVLGSTLRESRAAREEVARDRAEREEAARAAEEAANKLEHASARFERLTRALGEAVPDESNLERRFERVTRAMVARERCRGALRELARDPAWPDAQGHPRFAAALGEGRFDPTELRRAEAEAMELTEAIGDGREAIARLEEQLARERPLRTRSEIDSEIATLQEERAEAILEHDRLFLVSAALLEGERRHREEHQPAILQSASRWLEAITAGRYRDLGYEPPTSPKGHGSLTVFSREADGHVPVEAPLSRGVREQAHLALRLGAADAADNGLGQEPLPLLLDEALVHWDEGRRAGLYRALAARAPLKGSRQVFLFTCHGHLAQEAEMALGARRIDL